MRLLAIFLRSAAVASIWSTAAAAVTGPDVAKAPPPFGYRNAMVVPVDFETLHIDYVFDAQTRRATARAELVFSTGETGGFPLIDLVPNPTSVTLDGAPIDPTDFPVIDDPHFVTKFRVLRKALAPSSNHTLQVEYRLSSSDVTFSNGSVRVGFFMSDLATGGRDFFEQYGPANYEFDTVKTTFSVSVTGTPNAHEVFTNGNITGHTGNSWRIEFPEYFNTSAFYFHLSEKGRFNVSRYSFPGKSREIPVTVYSSSSSLTSSGVARSRQVLAELENTYGAFAHDKLVIYVTPDGGGMEYCGATMTSLSALGHEITHSYFARGVMPANGNAGWIDEAVASWRDNGYPRASSAPNRSPVNLGGFSSYRRHTTRDAYSSGAQLISEFDRMFAGQGGMKVLLRDLYTASKHTTLTVHDFKNFLENSTGQDLQQVFDRYVFGRSERGQAEEQARDDNFFGNFHPRPYTKDELAVYR